MRTAFVCCALASLSCSHPDDPCASYLPNQELHDYCYSTTLALKVEKLSDAALACDASGAWSRDCRSAWVDRSIGYSTATTQELLNFCQDEDCRLLVLDGKPLPDLLQHLQLCDQAGRYQEDCRGHARERWSLSRPAPEEIHRIATAVTPWITMMADMVGVALGCGGQGACGETADPGACEKAKVRSQGHPELCRRPR